MPIDLTTLATSTATSTSNFTAFYEGLVSLVTNNPPFGFVFDTIDLFNNLATSTASSTLALPAGLSDEIVNPIRTAMSWLLWILFGVFATTRLVKFNW